MAAETPIQDPYTLALGRLSGIPTNLSATALFRANIDTATLLSQALPEMRTWMSRAAITSPLPFRAVHVAGTKGKGSTSAFISSILSQYATELGSPRGAGLYTSPHVGSVRERICLGGKPLGQKEFAHFFNSVWEELEASEARENADLSSEEQVLGRGTKPFYFRFMTLVAFRAFSEITRDAVIECGIGGEYDPTNVLKENVTACVVTQLGIDHVAMLGDTLDKIAWNKAGIFKKGVKAFTRRLDDEPVMAVLRGRADEKEAVLVEVDDEEVIGWEGVGEGAMLEGPFQKFNMALAVYAAREHLMKAGISLEGPFGGEKWRLRDGGVPERFLEGLRNASLRGRCERFVDKRGVLWHLDGAHTEDSLKGVGEWFAERASSASRRVLVFNSQYRDLTVLLPALFEGARKMLGEEAQVFTDAVFSRNDEREGGGEEEGNAVDLEVQQRAERLVTETLEPGLEAGRTVVVGCVDRAVEEVIKIWEEGKSKGEDVQILVTGSFYLVGSVIRVVDDVEE